MRRLFAGYPPDRLRALRSNQSKRDSAPFDPVPQPEDQLSVPEIQIHRRLIHQLALLLNYMLIPWTVWRGVKLVREQIINAIFTVPWDQYTVAAYFIHRFTAARSTCMPWTTLPARDASPGFGRSCTPC